MTEPNDLNKPRAVIKAEYANIPDQNYPAEVIDFIETLIERLPGVTIAVEAGIVVVGSLWLNCLLGDEGSTVEWRPNQGFGVNNPNLYAGYGVGPDEIYKAPHRAAERVARWLENPVSSDKNVRWTNKVPTKTGFYWYKDETGTKMVTEIIELNGVLFAQNGPGGALCFAVSCVIPTAWWAGPISEPDEPKETEVKGT